MRYDLIVVGCGPAGMSAAIYAKRSNLNVLVIEKDAPGGKLLHLDKINNYLGFNNVSGIDLALSMYDHFNSFDIPFSCITVTAFPTNIVIFATILLFFYQFIGFTNINKNSIIIRSREKLKPFNCRFLFR